MTSKENIASAIKEYNEGVLLTKDIAAKYHVSPSTITVWARQSGVRLRTQGRRKQDVPTSRQRKMLEMASVKKYHEVGAAFGITKQAVHRVVRRWSGFVKPRQAPYAPGDIIRWNRQTFTVVNSSVSGGTLRDRKGQLVRCVSWDTKGMMPVKVGKDPNVKASD